MEQTSMYEAARYEALKGDLVSFLKTSSMVSDHLENPNMEKTLVFQHGADEVPYFPVYRVEETLPRLGITVAVETSYPSEVLLLIAEAEEGGIIPRVLVVRHAIGLTGPIFKKKPVVRFQY